jgi:hypothetical protein
MSSHDVYYFILPQFLEVPTYTNYKIGGLPSRMEKSTQTNGITERGSKPEERSHGVDKRFS